MSSPDGHPDRLADAARILADLSIDLARSIHLAKSPNRLTSHPNPCSREVSQEAVSWLIGARRARAEYLPEDLFSDPAWDILLELLRAEIAHHRACVTDLCRASRAPATTAVRYLRALAQRGMITRRADPHDGRRVYVELAPDVSEALRQYFANVIEVCPAGQAGPHE